MNTEKQLIKIIEDLFKNEHLNGKHQLEGNVTQVNQESLKGLSDTQADPVEHIKTPNIVNLTLKPPGNEQIIVTNELPPGKAWVINNEIYVEGIPNQNALPCITPTEGIKLFVNGKLVNHNVTVSALDYIYVEFEKKETQLDIKITKSPDGLSAYMSVKLATKSDYVLKNQSPKRNLVLKVNAIKNKYFTLSLNDLLAKIEEEGVKHGVDYMAIQDFLTNPRDGKIIIAKGTYPTESRDDSVDVLFPEKTIKQQYSSAEKVDFYNFQSIPSVDSNTLLALKREGEIGQPGISVNGEMILPRTPKRITLKAGKGVRQEKNMIFSTISGRPMIRKIGQTWLFYVDPYLVNYGDIDLSVGNQTFRGNIKVLGNICDGIVVRAGGNIEVLGCINRANVIAMESVWANKCIGAQVQAGGDSYYISQCILVLKQLQANLKKLHSSINVLIEHPVLKDFTTRLGLLVLLLIEKKIPQIPKLLRDAVRFLKVTPVDMPPEIVTLVEMLKEHLPPRNLTIEKLDKLIEYIEFAQEFFEQVLDGSADLYANYVLNSIISATGNVHIASQGCFSSKITAGGSVYISGVIRGGEVVAGGDIVVSEAGSELGTKTILKTEANKRVRILEKVYDGVIINIGGRINQITVTGGPIEFNYDGVKNIV